MSADHDKPEPFAELFPEVNAAGALRAGFQERSRSSAEKTRAVSSATSRPGSDRGGYELQGEIARGGMGVIVKARDRELGRDVALKILRDELSGEPRLVQRFLEEARVTARLDHPGIVPVHEVGRDAQGRAYFAMRLVRGRELKRIIELAHAGSEGWNQTRALSVIQKVCEAMAYAHEKGVLHRDLKPSNVMVGEFGEVYVMDWGLARLIGAADTHDLRLRDAPLSDGRPRARASSATRDVESPIVTMDGEVLGTPCYMAPEQAQGRIAELGPRSDVYSVGAMLYHLLAGEMPYVPAGSSVGSRKVLLDLVQGPPRPLNEVRSDIPSELIAISEKAMAREPEGRYPDMLAMAEDVRAFLERRVVRAYETGPWAEARKWVHRNRALSAAMLLAVLALVTGLLVSLSLKARSDANYVRAENSADVANEERDRALKIASFLEDTLAGVGPSVALGRDTTMLREMMDAASARIDKGELASAPQAELKLMLVIGNALREIAQYDKAEPILKTALAKAEHLYPDGDLLLAMIQSELGLALEERGDFDGAERLHRDALALRRRIHAGDDVDVASSLENLAAVLRSRGDLAGAEASLRKALSINKRFFTGDRRELATNLINLGVVLQARGDLAGAEPCFSEAIAMQERLFRGDHPDLAVSLDNLASARAANNDSLGAEDFHRRALAMRRRLLPHDHIDIATSLNNLGAVLQERGDLSRAEPLYREALEIERRLFIGDHARVAASIGNLATLMQERGEFTAAESLSQEALDMRRRIYPGDHGDLVHSLFNLGMVKISRHDLGEAELLMREGLEMARRLYPVDHPDLANAVERLALLLQIQNDLPGAEALYREALEIRKRLYPGDRYEVAKSTFDLARVIKVRNDDAACDPLFREALRMYRALGEGSGPNIAVAQVEFGQVLIREKHFAEAEETLLAAADFLERNPNPNPEWYSACVRRIVDNYTAWNEADPNGGHAEPIEDWKQKLAELQKK